MKMYRFFLYIGIVGGFALALPFIDYRMALIIFVIAMVGYNGSIIFYDAFIVEMSARMMNVWIKSLLPGMRGGISDPHCLF